MRQPFVQRFRLECRQTFVRAAAVRFADGAALAEAGRRSGAAYLWGYSIEMWLKAAYFKQLGFSPAQPITVPIMSQQLSQRLSVKPRNLHDLKAWAEALINLRQVLGRPIPTHFASDVIAHCRRIADVWTETNRYHENQLWPSEFAAFRGDVHWIKNQVRFI